jgi:hypothetical protein
MVTFGFAVVRSMAANVQMAVPPTRYNVTPEVLTTSRNRGNWDQHNFIIQWLTSATATNPAIRY